MVFSLHLYRRLHAQLDAVKGNLDALTRGLFAAYLAILILFVGGYAFVITVYFLDLGLQATVWYRLFCEYTFLLGSVFVMVGTAADIRLTNAIHRANLALIRALVNTVEARDINLKGHSMHVAAIVMLLYRQLPKAVRKRYNPNTVEYAALLHDIGKMGISEGILDKPGPLNTEELEQMRAHPKIGKSILAHVPGFQDVCRWICYHHERVDGDGYYGLPGEQVPLISRLIAVADTYSAIVMCRSYKARRSHQEALAILKSCAGSQLDARTCELFLRIEHKVRALQPMVDATPCFPSGNDSSLTQTQVPETDPVVQVS